GRDAWPVHLRIIEAQDVPVVLLGLGVCSPEGLGRAQLHMELDQAGRIVKPLQQGTLGFCRKVAFPRVWESVSHCIPDTRFLDFAQKSNFATEPDKALAYCRQAGDKALARSAYREAMGYFEQALSALPHLPEQYDTREQALDLRLALRNVLWTLGELGRLFVTLQEAAELAEALGDPHHLGWVSVYLLAHFAQVGDPDRALAAGQRALALATTLGDMGLTVVAQHY